MLTLRGGIPRPMRIFPESLSQAMFVGVMLVGRLGVIVMILLTALNITTITTTTIAILVRVMITILPAA